ncbi:MAG: response regulator [Syntrophobacteraceae bacterium]|jgi:PAS domain S-box-containing protein|nr:response regulator [Syntrophobacteraceae bacterium]
MVKKDWKLLLIDDDPGIRKVMSITLEDAGYRVQTAPSGEEGLVLCLEWSPQIVITDIRMPGMDGLEVLRCVKERYPDTEVIVVTAFSELDFAVKALQLGASDFITKPVNDDALQVALKRAKERYSTRKELRDYTAIIEEKWMETAEELAKTFNFQQILIDSSIDGIVACDQEGRVIIFNKSMEAMLGFSRQEAIGVLTLDRFFADGEYNKFRAKLQSDEFGGRDRLFLYESTLRSAAGLKIPVQVSASILFEEQQSIGVVGFFRDLRDIRRLTQQFADQARLLQQDKMISLGRLAASVVHEINNPLSGLLNYARLMLKILGQNELTRESSHKFSGYLNLMESELSRCSKIVSNLLAFSRMSKLEFSEVDINELLARSLLLSQHRLSLQNIQAETRLDAAVPKVQGDFNQLQQCIINLIFNAIDAMPEGGRLLLESRLDPKQELVLIRVKDNGCGISKEDQMYIFDPFFTTKKEGKGLGLGLSTVYGIIDRHKGTISVESKPDEGSTFTIKLPIRK